MRFSYRTVLLLLVVFAALVSFPPAGSAQYGATGVYYDYTQITIGGRAQFVLVPRGTEAFAQSAPPQVSIPAAFRVLRENKRATYGNASLTLSDADLASGRVVVHIDPEQRDWYLIVVAETVYTFGELGIREVMFPGISEEAFSRADVPFLAYVLHAPMWRALPDRPVALGMIELPDGDLLDTTEFYSRWSAGDRALIRHLLSYLDEDSPVIQAGVLNILSAEQVPGAVEAVLPLLTTASEAVRVQAVNFLAASGEPRILERLAEVMTSDDSAAVRNAAAEALGSTGDSHFQFFELSHRLAAASDVEIPAVLAELTQTGDPRAVEVLNGYMAHGEAPVRQSAINGLIVLGGTGGLFELLESDTPLFIRLQIAESLIAQTSGEDRVRAMEHLVSARDGQIAMDHLGRLIEEGQGSQAEYVRRALERQLSHTDTAVRIACARELARIGNPESLEAFASTASREGDSGVKAVLDEAAVELMTHISANDVREHAEGRNLFLKRAAYMTLGYMAQQGRANQATFRTLIEGLETTEAEIRGASVLGLATYASEDAFAAIVPLAQDPDAGVRRDVARALGSFRAGQGIDLLTSFLGDADENIVAAALLSVADRTERDLLQVVIDLTHSPSARIRAAAAIAVSGLSYDEIERAVIDSLMATTSDPEPEVRMAVADALGAFNNEMAVLGISPLTQDRETEVRLRAIAALADTGHPSAVGLLLSLLEDGLPDIRIAALRALGEVGAATDVPQIMSSLANEEDPAVLDEAQSVVNALQGN